MSRGGRITRRKIALPRMSITQKRTGTHLTAATAAIASEGDGKAARCYNLSHRFSHERRIHDFAVPAR